MHLKAAHLFFLENGIPFVSYRLPGTVNVVTLSGGTFSAEGAEDDDNTFVFAPFRSDHGLEKLYYKAENVAFGTEIDIEGLTFTEAGLTGIEVPAPIVVTKDIYLNQAAALISAMKKRQAKKVVLSRVVAAKLALDDQPKVFESLCSKHPGAFVYFLSDGKQMRWMGASPETLLLKKEQHYITMSLAGTKKSVDGQPENIQWNPKELEEQAFVTDYIHDVLRNLHMEDYTISGPETVFAGHLAHLKTTFHIPAEKCEAAQLIEKLHPTPAVCGLPQKEAFDLIFATELHNRAYYTGYLGILKPQEELKLFVNLRCMQLIGNEAYIYVGGGLTAASDPEAEWDETEAKAETLLSVFPNKNATLQHDAR